MKSVSLGRVLALLLAVSLLCASCSETKATTMSLMKTEGIVDVVNDKGKSVTPTEQMKLYSGYGMTTLAASFAWINPDSVKLVKMDENSEIKIQKNGEALDILVKSGGLFFYVNQPLADDETMNIRTSTMTVGIRGTCGWVAADGDSHAQVYILEGAVTSTSSASSESADVRAGQMADLTFDDSGAADIAVSPFLVQDIPEYVMVELLADDDLAQAVLDASGLDVHNPYAVHEAAQRAYADIVTEHLDFYNDAHSQLAGSRFTNAQWMSTYYDAYRAAYPHISPSFLAYYTGWEALCYAYYDLDGNSINELLVGARTNPADPYVRIMGVYSFDRTEAVLTDTFYSAVLADGLIADYDNTGNISAVSRIGRDGYTPEPVTGTDIVLGSSVYDQDFASHGGLLADQLSWTQLTDGVVDFSTYLGRYVCDRTGRVLWFQQDNASGQYILYASRINDLQNMDNYDLTVTDHVIQAAFQRTGNPALAITPQGDELIVESLDASLSYLDGQYHRMGASAILPA